MSVRVRCAARILLALVVIGLVACAPVRVRESPGALENQSAREAQLETHSRWTLSARIFVSDGGDNNGSGDLDWHHDGERYDFTLRAPTGKTWKLSGDAGHATLAGVEKEPIRGSDPERLLRERLGWDVPVADLASWVRGARAPGGPAQLQFDENSLPAVLEQDGWKIDYREWFADMKPPMPRRVYATRGKARVKMAIERWSVDD